MSQRQVKREVNSTHARRSIWPKAPHHGKHTELQGFPNTRGLTPAPTKSKKK